MYVCMHVYIYIYIYTYIYLSIYLPLSLSIYIYIYRERERFVAYFDVEVAMRRTSARNVSTVRGGPLTYVFY